MSTAAHLPELISRGFLIDCVGWIAHLGFAVLRPNSSELKGG